MGDRSMTTWDFDHPPRGTCRPGCPLHGRCHCGCGRSTRISVQTDENGRHKGMPHVFSAGHHMRLFHPRAGAYRRSGVDVERVRPLIYWLRDRHGSMRAVAESLGMRESTLRGYAYKQRLKRVPPEAALRISRAVTSRLNPQTWNDWE